MRQIWIVCIERGGMFVFVGTREEMLDDVHALLRSDIHWEAHLLGDAHESAPSGDVGSIVLQADYYKALSKRDKQSRKEIE